MYCVMGCYVNKSYHLFEWIEFVCEEDEYEDEDAEVDRG